MLDKAMLTIQKYNMIQDNDCIIIGISGGADSVALFHFLYTIKEIYNLTLIGVHIHHGIRGIDADLDAKYVKNLCNNYKIDCKIIKYDIHKEAKKLKITEEEAGRLKRYEAFETVLKEYNGNKIAVAHTMNDQAETVFMRICRGTGLKGLTGILPMRDNIIRPFIESSREDTEQYCNQNNLIYKNDYTNNMDIYTRNKIRLQLIPWIKQNLNQSIIQTISNMSLLLQEEQNYIEQQSELAYNFCSSIDNNRIKLDIDKLKNYPLVIQKRIFRIAIYNLTKDLHDIELCHITNIIELIKKQTGKKINLTNNIIVHKQYNNLYFYIRDNITDLNFCYDLKLNTKIYIKEIENYIVSELICIEDFKSKPNNVRIFDYDKINGDIKIRNRNSGDKIYLKGIGNKKLKDFFIDIKLPKDERDKIPLIKIDYAHSCF